MTTAFDVLVVGAGPAGVAAALRAGHLGARTALVTRGDFGGMAANDGPVPVRALAHAARLVREARQLGRYGIAVGEPALDYPRLLARVREVVADVRRNSALRSQLDAVNVAVHEHCGAARLVDPHTVATETGIAIRAAKIILCTGGASRRLPVPGIELTATHSDAWSLSSVPPSMLVIGGGATGAQVASIFGAFGARVQLFEAGPRILATEDEDVSRVVADAFRESGIVVHERFGTIEAFERSPLGVRMIHSKGGVRSSAEATLAVLAVGWVADTAELGLARAGIETDARGFVRVDSYFRTSTPHILAAGDVIGGLMLVPQALEGGFAAGTNAVRGPTMTVDGRVSPIGSFTDPEYAQVGLTEAKARAGRDVIVAVVRCDSATRAIIDGRTTGFCKLIADRATGQILGCHVVGERAVEIAQVAAIAMASGMRVDELARVPLSFPTYSGMLAQAAVKATHELSLPRARPPSAPASRASGNGAAA